MKKNLLLPLLALFVGFKSYSQSIDKIRLDEYFALLEANNKYMGSVALSQNGKILYTKAIGFSDVEKGIKNNEETKFRIGSISKTFTTAIIFKAVEENKLKLTESLKNYFPTIENADKITISNLLNHRSGIHNFTNDDDYTQWNTQPKTQQELIAIIAKGKSEFTPDSKAEYSNSNFVLLTFILEKIYKKPYLEIVKEKITNPLKLNNTYVGGKINVKNNESNSYSYNGSWTKESETDMSIPLGAGAIVSNPTDLVKFFEALFTGKIISQNSIDQMKTIKDDYGMGLFMMPYGEKQTFGHTGGIDGFSSFASYMPDEKLTIAMTSNGRNYNGNQIVLSMMDIFYKKPFEMPNFKTINLNSEDLDQYLGIYASPDIPLKITITKKDNVLVAQATGQGELILDATDKHIFKFEAAGIVMEFIPSENKMILKQGAIYTFTKE